MVHISAWKTFTLEASEFTSEKQQSSRLSARRLLENGQLARTAAGTSAYSRKNSAQTRR